MNINDLKNNLYKQATLQASKITTEKQPRPVETIPVAPKPTVPLGMADIIIDDILSEIDSHQYDESSIFSPTSIATPTVPPVSVVPVEVEKYMQRWILRKTPPPDTSPVVQPAAPSPRHTLTSIKNIEQSTIIVYNATTTQDGSTIDKCNRVIRLSTSDNIDIPRTGSRSDLIFTSILAGSRSCYNRVPAYCIWIDMQDKYGKTNELKRIFGRPNPARRNKNHGPVIDYRSVNVVDGKYFKKYGPLPLEVSTLLWTLDSTSNNPPVILYGIDLDSLASKWKQLIQQLSDRNKVIIV